MLDYHWQAFILGILQGVTEFLPISSSAHLLILPWILGWDPFGIVFDVILHAGTLSAILMYFRDDWRQVLRQTWKEVINRSWTPQRLSLADAVVVGTVPAVLLALIGRSWLENDARVPEVTVVTLAGFGLLLGWADRWRGGRTLADLRWRDVLWIGAAQGLALIPGVSRSGITITAALWLGFTRPEAARFSFLLAGPIMFLGFLDALWEWLSMEGSLLPVSAVLIGFLTSFTVGYFCIRFLLAYLRRGGLWPFVLYRCALAAVIFRWL